MTLDDHEDPQPSGELVLQTIAMPRDTYPNGDIFGGWLVSQMDLAGYITAGRVAQGRVATVSIDSMNFMVPVAVGSVISCHTDVAHIGRSSIHVSVEVWAVPEASLERHKVTEGLFIFVAIDDRGRTRVIPD